ncbi:hypothetical protein B0H19DRAFT_1144495, partial [Mycena capillaripes]
NRLKNQCCKTKCKCERSCPGEPGRSCLGALRIECASLVPTRKRGPPKASLHQTKALFEVLLQAAANYSVALHERIDEDRMDVGDEEGRGSKDREIDLRAGGLLDDIAEDPLAREILVRIDPESSHGAVKARRQGVHTPRTITADVLRRARLGSSSSSFSHRHGKNRSENGSGSNSSDSPVHVVPPQSLPHTAPLRHGSFERTQHSPHHAHPRRAGCILTSISSSRRYPSCLRISAPWPSPYHRCICWGRASISDSKRPKYSGLFHGYGGSRQRFREWERGRGVMFIQRQP